MSQRVRATAAVLFLLPLAAFAQWNVPPESQRCPSRWGAGDERGSGNHMKNPEVVLRGARLIKTSEIATPNGLNKLGVQNAPAFFARGVLLDVAALKGVEMLGDTYEITPADLQQALARQGNMKLLPGDAIIINTGWGKLYGKDNARFMKTTPGAGVAAAEWLAKQDPLLVGSDNSPAEASPNPAKDLSLPGHQIFLVVNGIHILENLKLDELAAKKVYEFAFSLQPLKIQGATGSTVAPPAIR